MRSTSAARAAARPTRPARDRNSIGNTGSSSGCCCTSMSLTTRHRAVVGEELAQARAIVGSRRARGLDARHRTPRDATAAARSERPGTARLARAARRSRVRGRSPPFRECVPSNIRRRARWNATHQLVAAEWNREWPRLQLRRLPLVVVRDDVVDLVHARRAYNASRCAFAADAIAGSGSRSADSNHVRADFVSPRSRSNLPRRMAARPRRSDCGAR